MSINLSDLTSPNNQDVLAEITSEADFLDPIGKLKNLSRSPNSGGDALQTVALNQPKALPLDANGKGYCYLPVTTGNAPAVTFPAIGASDDFVLEMDVYLVDPLNFYIASSATIGSERFSVFNGSFINKTSSPPIASALEAGRCTLTVERNSGTITLKQDGVAKASSSDTGSYDFNYLSFNGQFFSSITPLNGYIQTCTLSIGGTEQLNIDFTATNVRHGDTKFKCATGQVVTINQAGNDPATVIKKSVLRFDGANSGLEGLFANNIDGGYMFAAFSVLGDGGAAWGRVFTTNLEGSGTDFSVAGAGFSLRNSNTTDLRTMAQGLAQPQTGMFDDANGDILHEVKLEGSDFSSKVNNAGFLSATHSDTIDSDRFNIGKNPVLSENAAIDLEFLAVFPADSVPDEATATKIRDYINKRNNVFDLKDGFGYYFYDATKAPVGAITTGSASWNGRIVGSDNGDTDKLATQATANDQPVSDGYVVTFADNSDHLDIPQVTLAAGDSYAWMVCGTSLGTFAYKLTVSSQTELSLLGHVGYTGYRKAGDLYGIILLPESASAADIESARSLLIDRGAADGTTAGSIRTDWYNRDDIVEFKHLNTSSVTASDYAWYSCQALEKFPALDLSNSTTLSNAWFGCTELSDFGAIQADSCVNFTSAWKGCSSLTSFPSDALLGTSANNVSFSGAWWDSGLTSFSTPLPTAGDCFAAFYNSDLETFNTSLPSATNLSHTWGNCSSLTDFPSDVFANWNPASISSGVFNNTWKNCTALTAQSVGNILQSIDASNQHGTDDGTSTGNPLGDSGIDIDYDGTTLSAATNSAVTSLKAKGWSIIVNNVTL